MARPFQLRYTDSNGDEQLIGRYMGDAQTDGSIDQGQVKNNGSGEYTRIEIKGDKDLQDRMPLERTSFENNLPEIILDVYSIDAGGFIERDRVFPLDTGKIESDDGEYRHDQLAGFEKYVSQQKTDTTIGPINTDLEDVVTTLLGEAEETYEVQTKGTIPSVNNYTFNGNIGKALRDIHRDYPQVKLWWTGQVNASGNQIVKLEEKGAGDVQETIVWPETEDYSLVEYEENDTSAVVNRATVIGTDGNGNEITVDTDDLTGTIADDIQDSKDRYGERSIAPRNIGYLEDQAHAEQIAENLLQLEAQPHLVIELPFQSQNVLNTSIDITDDRYNIDDIFTVVKQRDFFSDSTTQLELSFEKNPSEQRRNEIRDLGEERSKLYPGGETNVGNQTGNTEEVNDKYDDFGSDDHNHDVASKQSELGRQDSDYDATIDNLSIPDTESTSINVTVPTLAADVDNAFVAFHFSTDQSGDWRIEVQNTSSGATLFDESFTFQFNNASLSLTVVDANAAAGDTISMTVYNNTGSAQSDTAALGLSVDPVGEHSHNIEFEAARGLNNTTGGDNVVQAIYETLDVETVEKLISALEEIKTDR